MLVYCSHVKVLLFSMPLQSSSGDIRTVSPAICGLYEATLSYLTQLNTADVNKLRFSHNSIFMIGTYVAVMAIKLTSLHNQFAWIDVERLIKQAEGVAILFMKAGYRKSKSRRKAVACHFGAYLEWLLRRYGMREHLHALARYRELHDQEMYAQHEPSTLTEDSQQRQQQMSPQAEAGKHNPYFDVGEGDARRGAIPSAEQAAAATVASNQDAPFLLSPSSVFFGLSPNYQSSASSASASAPNTTNNGTRSATSSAASSFLSDSSFNAGSPYAPVTAADFTNGQNYSEVWGDQVAFSADFDVLSWAQRFLSEGSS